MLLGCIGTASAGCFDGLFGEQQNNITNISNLQFNILDGYTLNEKADNYENEIGQYVDVYGSPMLSVITDNDYSKVPENAEIVNISKMTYYNEEDKTNMIIEIKHHFNGTEQTSDKLNLNKNISGVEGQFEKNDAGDRASFTYIKDGSLVVITANNENIISNVIVK